MYNYSIYKIQNNSQYYNIIQQISFSTKEAYGVLITYV